MSRLDDESIARLMEHFYAAIRRDPELGPVFERIIGDAWNEHLHRINLFWCSALGLRKGYVGSNFMPAHLRHAEIRVELLESWMALFEQTVATHIHEQYRAKLLHVARAMAENLRISLAKRQPRQ